MDKILSKLRREDFEIKNIDIFRIEITNKKVYDYAKSGRSKHLLHLVTSGNGFYEFNGKRMSFESGTLIFIPEGTKYKTISGTNCAGIGICFECENLFSDAETGVYFVEEASYTPKLKQMFEAGYIQYKRSPLDALISKATVYSIFSFLISALEQKSAEYRIIKPAIDYICTHYTENLPIQAYADICNLSESYFRKKFSNYTGMSPIEYRNNLRFAEAKRMYQDGFGTEYIAEQLGFCDASYMLKIYKRNNGASLKTEAKFV